MINNKTMQSKLIGKLIKTSDWHTENDWVGANEIPIPFFDNKVYTVRFEEVLSTKNYFEKAEEAIQTFFNVYLVYYTVFVNFKISF